MGEIQVTVEHSYHYCKTQWNTQLGTGNSLLVLVGTIFWLFFFLFFFFLFVVLLVEGALELGVVLVLVFFHWRLHFSTFVNVLGLVLEGTVDILALALLRLLVLLRVDIVDLGDQGLYVVFVEVNGISLLRFLVILSSLHLGNLFLHFVLLLLQILSATVRSVLRKVLLLR